MQVFTTFASQVDTWILQSREQIRQHLTELRIIVQGKPFLDFSPLRIKDDGIGVSTVATMPEEKGSVLGPDVEVWVISQAARCLFAGVSVLKASGSSKVLFSYEATFPANPIFIGFVN